jgi:hypothetical protein
MFSPKKDNTIKNTYHIVVTCLWLIPLFFHMGCAGFDQTQFQKKIQRMPDRDLVNYYHGINGRIKDIDRDIKQEDRSAYTEHEQFVSNMPFVIGGEGYQLIRKKKLIKKEMNHRKISP